MQCVWTCFSVRSYSLPNEMSQAKTANPWAAIFLQSRALPANISTNSSRVRDLGTLRLLSRRDCWIERGHGRKPCPRRLFVSSSARSPHFVRLVLENHGFYYVDLLQVVEAELCPMPYNYCHVSKTRREKTTLIGQLTPLPKRCPKWIITIGSETPRSTVEMCCHCEGRPKRRISHF